MSGVSKIHAVLGGFHLSGLDAERIDRVVEALRGFEVDYLVPQHCTGFEAPSSSPSGWGRSWS